jgi:hypothetical protein
MARAWRSLCTTRCSILHTSTFLAQPLPAYNARMPRRLVGVKDRSFEGFGCSECTWVFEPSGGLVGESLDKMKQKFEAERDKEFAAHACAQHPKSTETGDWIVRSQKSDCPELDSSSPVVRDSIRGAKGLKRIAIAVNPAAHKYFRPYVVTAISTTAARHTTSEYNSM